MSLRSVFQIAVKALAKNKLQTALTMIGMTIGVATVLTMIAVGSGAQAAIEDQVKSAGMNLIFISAGNYKQKTEDDFGVVENAVWRSDRPSPFRLVFHPEDDPLEKHDHPLASQRLGDLE
ncbi:MAG: ABC transporter permease, partial [Bryobacteraceae bacterium]